MNKWRVKWSTLPLKWKLTIWCAALLSFLFVVYNGIQYAVVNQWIYHQQKNQIEKQLKQIDSHFSERGSRLPEEILESRQFLEQMNDKQQLIRILDSSGRILAETSNGVPSSWVSPMVVNHFQLMDQWHQEDHLLIARSPLGGLRSNGTIEIIQNLDAHDQLLEFILMVMVAGGVGAILLSALAGVFVSRQLLLPIQALTDTMNKVQEEGLQERVNYIPNGDELSKVAIIFNQMMDRLEKVFLGQKQFVEDASHELRTPVTIIEGHLALLQRWGKQDPQVLDECLEASLQEMKRLKSLIKELLELSRIDQWNQGQVEVVPISPIDVIRQVMESLKLLHPDVHFEMNDSSFEDTLITITPEHLGQLLLIFLDNAIKYSVDVKQVKVTSCLQDKEYILQIEDSGMGIPEEDLPFIFDRFYRVDKSRTRQQGGNGLGLAIAKRLVDLYKGKIEVESKVGKGTIFILSIPL